MENLHLIVGLGNPGPEYAQTRHNAGFLVVQELARRGQATWSAEKKWKADCATLQIGDKSVILCCPRTFMNASGEAVAAVAGFRQVGLPALLVVVDDADLQLGQLRLRPGGSSGGHHGLLSIEEHLGSQEFARLRVGIGRKENGVRDIAGYVLEKFQPGERKWVARIIGQAADQAECWLRHGVARAMNEFNGAVTPPI